MKEIKITEQTVTPDMAKKWLEKSKFNRRLSEPNVKYLALQMKQGTWMQTGDSIKFGADGALLDGQHRLNAVINYGQPIKMFVAEGLKSEVFQVLDTGKSRSAADVVAASGYKYAHNLASAARAVLIYQSGVYSKTNDGRLRASNKMILDFVQKHEESLMEIVTFCQNQVYQNFRFVPLSTLCMLYWTFSKKNQSKTDEFFGKYANGIDLSESNPIRLLREKLIKESNNKSRLNNRDKAALMIYTWNNFIQGKRVTQLLLPRNYTFPKPL